MSLQRNGGNCRESAASVPKLRGKRRWFAVVAMVGVSGFLIGRFLSWADSPPKPAAGWIYHLPELPPEFEPSYRELFNEASRVVSVAMQTHPDSVHAVSALAVLYYLAHDRLGEQSCWEQCLRLAPQNWLAFSRLVALAQQAADYQRIVELSRQALADDPNNAKYYGALGSALMYLNRGAEAKPVLEQAARAEASAETYLLLGEVCNQLEQPQKARRYLRTAVALDPSRMDVWYALSKVCAKLDATEEAAQARRQFENLKGDQRTIDTSERNVRDGLRDHQFVPIRISEIITYAGKAFLEGGRTQEAEACFLRASRISSADVDSRRLLCELADEQGRFGEALRWIEELKILEPKNHLHLRNEGLLYARMQKLDEAERVFREICRLEPARAFGYAALADLFLRRGRALAEARDLAERAVDLEPTAQHWTMLATIAGQMGDRTAARAALERAQALDPGNPQIKSAYASIFPEK